MREPFTQLYLHCVWSTWDRLPLITPDVERRLYAAIVAKCRELGCQPIRVGGVENHVHVLVRLHTTVSVADLVKEMKGSSSHLMTHQIAPGEFFKWQGAYGAFTLSRDEVPTVAEYISSQKRHHADNSAESVWEKTEITDAAELQPEVPGD